MLTGIDIVPCTARRHAELVALILAIQRDEFGFDVGIDDQPDLLDIAAFYQSNAGGFWLALDGDDVVGTIALRDFGQAQGALRKMFVRDTHRGRAHGVAARLLETLVDHAREHGLETLWLGTTERFVAAHRFYEKHGFERINADRLPPSFPRMSVDTRFYRRFIGR